MRQKLKNSSSNNKDLKEVFSWLRERQKKLSSPIVNLGDLANIYLEEEFSEQD